MLYLVRAVSTDWRKVNCSIDKIFFCVLLLFLFVLSFFFSFSFFSFFCAIHRKNRWQLFVFVGDAALKVPTSLKHRIQNLQDFLLNKKPTPEKGAAASPQDKHTQRLITSGGVPSTQERWIRGPFASCRMDGNMQN